ncbi:MAG: ribosome biogenesis GTPase Der, partial [Candidatus Aminicenantes bacterium]|nr:ribosome biogenesis GTPase Der [Candidatus Aminicenantes bacterium]
MVQRLDGKRDIASAEEELYFRLKRRGLSILLVVNKFDSPVQEESMTADYYRLGDKAVLFVSAEHKINIEQLEEAIVAALPDAEAAGDDRTPLRIAIVGRTNVGKSSLVNRLAGAERLIVSEMPGTTRDSTDTLLVRDGKLFSLVDPAGIRKIAAAEDGREKAGIIRAKENIRRADVVCLVLDAGEFPTRQDARIAQLALDSGRPLLIALNKWDLVEKAVVRPEAVRARVFRKLGFVGYAPLLFVSARTGQRVVKILDTAEQVHRGATTRVETSKLNQFLAKTAETHPPRLKNGARAKLRYITQKSVSPPAFILFLGSRGHTVSVLTASCSVTAEELMFFSSIYSYCCASFVLPGRGTGLYMISVIRRYCCAKDGVPTRLLDETNRPWSSVRVSVSPQALRWPL